MCPAPLWQALEIAKYQYYAAGKRAQRKQKRFDPSDLAVELAEIGHDTNLVGWTLTPRNMHKNEDGGGGREIFHPVDALDCAAFRGKAQGVLVARATYDADHAVHPVSMSHMLAPESDLSVGSHINAERHLLGDDVMNKFGHVTFVDGHPSLEGENTKQSTYTYNYTYTYTYTYTYI